ncbi:hypothetical protein AOLI_G00072600 [Acnodon oligacanthus]
MEELLHSLRSLQPQPTPPAPASLRDLAPASLTTTSPLPSSPSIAVPLSIPDKKGSRRTTPSEQGNSAALDFSLTFHTLAAESGWNDQALETVYRNGLNEKLKSEMACKDDAQTLDGLIRLSFQLDNLIRSRKSVFSPSTTPAHTVTRTTEPEDMECDRTRITPEEKQR